MIHPESRTLAWIRQVSDNYGVRDIALVEKTVRAFSLLESLVRSGCPLIFKGGTSLMLHYYGIKRLSIDIDIICPPGTQIEEYLEKFCYEYGFEDLKMVERISYSDIPKNHAKFFYQVVYPTNGMRDKILLDVLYEENNYCNIIDLPIQGDFLKQLGDPVRVKLPSIEDLLGDKLTAFAPHTTGVPFFKGEKDCSLDINKQLFDIGLLFDFVKDLNVTIKTFHKIVERELKYKGLDHIGIQPVLDDIFNTALCVTLRGQLEPEEFKLLQRGISRVGGFILGDPYKIDKAIVNAAKAAYLSTLISKSICEIRRYDANDDQSLKTAKLLPPLNPKLNKLKKNNIEAFFYWNKIYELL